MFNNFIGGGQVFLHKIRMFKQVLLTSVIASLILGIFISGMYHTKYLKNIDLDASITYVKAIFANKAHPLVSAINLGPDKGARVDAYSSGKLYKHDMQTKSVLSSSKFKTAYNDVWQIIKHALFIAVITTIASVLLIFAIWSRFGQGLKSEINAKDSNYVLSAREVTKRLRKKALLGDLKVGKMHLVKDMDTRHFLVTGTTGSGKTNLIHTLLVQVISKSQPTIVIDQTGEMIAKYYDESRGDIIFNPFDARSQTWDFWQDCNNTEDIKRFSKILLGFNRKKSNAKIDPFWENAAIEIFIAAAQFIKNKNGTVEELTDLVCNVDLAYLKFVLTGTKVDRYLGGEDDRMANSIAAVLASNSDPMTYLRSESKNGKFSLQEYFNKIDQGEKAWLFLSTKPSARELTLPLISCILELAFANLMDIGIKNNRKLWFVIDELPTLGNLPAFSTLMSEGRKYGACIIASMQSLNQLYDCYGQYTGSAIFGQFGTSFFFTNHEPAITKMISDMSGKKTIVRQNKNTSFGANELRDGVSYHENLQYKPLIEGSDIASLGIGECYAVLPEPSVRFAKINVPYVKLVDKNIGFLLKQQQDEEANDSKKKDKQSSDSTAVNTRANVNKKSSSSLSSKSKEFIQDVKKDKRTVKSQKIATPRRKVKSTNTALSKSRQNTKKKGSDYGFE